MSTVPPSIEPGATVDGRPVAASGLYGPGTHRRSPLDNACFGRLIDFGLDTAPDWATFDPADLAAAGGAALPAPLRELWHIAVDANWLTRIVWQATYDADGPAGVGHPFATVEASHRADPGEQQGRVWYFRYTWHTRPTGTYRLFTRLAKTPTRPAAHDGPSLRQARAIITANPGFSP